MRKLLLALVVAAMAWSLAGRPHTPVPAPDVVSAPTIEALKPLAALMTHRVEVVDAVTLNITGLTGGLRAAVIVRGDALVAIDLTRARMDDIDHLARTAVIVLPQPHVTNARIDHERSSVFSVEATGLWALVPSDEGRAEIVDQAMQQAQRAVHRAAGEPAVIEQARTRAEELVRCFFAESLRWTVAVRWVELPGVQAGAATEPTH